MDVSLPLAGTFFFLCGIWWNIQITKKFYQSKQQRIPFTSSTSFPCCRTCRRLPIESLVKLAFSIGYIVYEIVLATDFGKATTLNYVNLMHMTVFAFFASCFIIEIILHFKVKIVVSDLDYITLTFAFGALALLNGCQSPTEYSVDCVVHNLVQYTAIVCGAITALEMKFRNNVIFPLFRGVFLMVLGTWTVHAYIIMTNNSLDTDTRDDSWMVSLYFTWHCAVNGILMLLVWLLTYKMFTHNKCCCLPIEGYEEGLCLHNRVRFDYPLLDRLESDVE